MDAKLLKTELENRAINLSAICRKYDIVYKTFWGWLNQVSQETLSDETEEKVNLMCRELNIIINEEENTQKTT